MVLMSEYLHEQTGLTAGTIAHDDELASNLGHLCNELVQEETRGMPRFGEVMDKAVGGGLKRGLVRE
jgi:hypothetical protein